MPALHEVQIEYIDGWSHPNSDTLIWEREHGARLLHILAVPCVEQSDQPLDLPDLLQAFLWANQWSAVNGLVARSAEDERDLRLIIFTITSRRPGTRSWQWNSSKGKR